VITAQDLLDPPRRDTPAKVGKEIMAVPGYGISARWRKAAR
jgi:hypothetical protein